MYACVCVCVCPSFSLTSTHLASPRLASPRPAPPPRSAGAAPFLFIGHTSLYVTHPFFNFILLFIMKNKPGCCIRFIDHVPTLAIIRWVFLFDFNSSQRWTDQSGFYALLKLRPWRYGKWKDAGRVRRSELGGGDVDDAQPVVIGVPREMHKGWMHTGNTAIDFFL